MHNLHPHTKWFPNISRIWLKQTNLNRLCYRIVQVGLLVPCEGSLILGDDLTELTWETDSERFQELSFPWHSDLILANIWKNIMNMLVTLRRTSHWLIVAPQLEVTTFLVMKRGMDARTNLALAWWMRSFPWASAIDDVMSWQMVSTHIAQVRLSDRHGKNVGSGFSVPSYHLVWAPFGCLPLTEVVVPVSYLRC